MGKVIIPNYTVIKDTREKNGWFFSKYDKCEGMTVSGMPTGDYTIEGFEDIVCVERKACTSEIAMNLGRKKEPFRAEMERMKDFPFSFIICEFSISDLLKYPENSKVPDRMKGKVKVTGKYLLKSIVEFQIWYNTKILFCDNKHNAFVVCNSIFKRLNELFNKEQNA